MTDFANSSGTWRTDERWEAVGGATHAAIRAGKQGHALDPQRESSDANYRNAIDRVCRRLLEDATGGRMTFVGDKVISRGGKPC